MTMAAMRGYAAPQRATMRPPSTMDPTAMLADENLLYEYVRVLKLARKVNVRQGNVEAVTATVQFVTDAAALIPFGTRRIAFQDNLGELNSSGVVGGQTRADGNLFGGKIPSGEMILMRGFGLNVESDAAITAQVVNQIGRNVGVTMQLRRTPVNMGSVRDWPEVIGARGTGNGNSDRGTIPFTPPLVLEPLQDYTVEFVVERQVGITLVGFANTPVDVHVRCPSLRIYDPIVLGKS